MAGPTLGTRCAARAAVRASIVVILCAACAGPMRPAVIPKLSELPVEPERRNAVLDSSHAQPGPENRPVSKRARQAETAAATAAAIIGSMFSKTKNVTLGTASMFDENRLFEDPPKREERAAEGSTASEPEVETGALVPWVQLK